MIKLGSTVSRVDTSLVKLEADVVGLDGNRDGLLVDGGHQSFLGVDGHIGAVLQGSSLFGVIVLAFSLDSLVGVLRLKGDAIVDDVVEGIVHKTTIASIVSVGVRAVDELLLRVGVEGLALEEGSTFD